MSAKYFFRSAITASACCGVSCLPEKSCLPSPMIFSFAKLIKRPGIQNVVRVDELLDLFDHVVKAAQPLVRHGTFRAQCRRGPDHSPFVAELLHHAYPFTQFANIL